jgi:hypothetical protein
MSKIELLDKCEVGILKYKSKSKSQLLELINAANINPPTKYPQIYKVLSTSKLDNFYNHKKHKSRRTSTSSIYVY